MNRVNQKASLGYLRPCLVLCVPVAGVPTVTCFSEVSAWFECCVPRGPGAGSLNLRVALLRSWDFMGDRSQGTSFTEEVTIVSALFL